MLEALHRCYWSEFESWLHEEDMEFWRSQFESWLHEEDMEFWIEPLSIKLNKLKSALLKHFSFLGKHGSENFTFWLEYLDMVSLLLDFFSAERNGN